MCRYFSPRPCCICRGKIWREGKYYHTFSQRFKSSSCDDSARGDSCSRMWYSLPQSTYIYRVQSVVWRLPNYRTIDPPPPLHPASVYLPLTKGRRGGGGTHSPGGEGSIFRQTPDIGLASYSIIPLGHICTVFLSQAMPIFQMLKREKISRSTFTGIKFPPINEFKYTYIHISHKGILLIAKNTLMLHLLPSLRTHCTGNKVLEDAHTCFLAVL